MHRVVFRRTITLSFTWRVARASPTMTCGGSGLCCSFRALSGRRTRCFVVLASSRLGPDLTPEYLAQRALGAKRRISKRFCWIRRVIAGLGNIYVCEALFRTRLNPTKSASVLATKNWIAECAHTTLGAGNKGDLAGGSAGWWLNAARLSPGRWRAWLFSALIFGLRARGRDVQAPQCKSLIKRRVQSGRSTFYCPTCQK